MPAAPMALPSRIVSNEWGASTSLNSAFSVVEGIAFECGGLHSEDLFEGFSWKEIVDDGCAAFAFGIVEVNDELDWHFRTGVGVGAADARVEHFFLHQLASGFVVAVGDFEEFLVLAVEDFATAGISVRVHGVNREHRQDAVCGEGFLAQGAVVWAAREHGARAVLVTHDADVWAIDRIEVVSIARQWGEYAGDDGANFPSCQCVHRAQSRCHRRLLQAANSSDDLEDTKWLARPDAEGVCDGDFKCDAGFVFGWW